MTPQKEDSTSAKGSKKASTKAATGERVTVENVNVPGYTTQLDATHYHAMRKALLKVLPASAPGLTQTELREAVQPQVPQDLFPDSGKIGWWAKAVQLDLEAKKIIVREPSKPLRWHKLATRR